MNVTAQKQIVPDKVLVTGAAACQGLLRFGQERASATRRPPSPAQTALLPIRNARPLLLATDAAFSVPFAKCMDCPGRI